MNGTTPAPTSRPNLSANQPAAPALEAAGLWQPGQPLRLHLGCGEQHLDGYINIDYPPTQHTVQTRVAADVFADITQLQFPARSVDEIRLHHLLEHFKRAQALALLIRWQQWLKIDGRLHLETPDIIGSARQLASRIPYAMKQAVIRHCFGSQEADWANHYEGWSEEKFDRVLTRFGFQVKTRAWRWPHPPHLANVEAIAIKTEPLSRGQLLAAADGILQDYMVAEVASERAMWNVWRQALRRFLGHDQPDPTLDTPLACAGWLARLDSLPSHPDSPAFDHLGFDNDNPATNGEHHLIDCVIRPGDSVLDVGANVGDWSRRVLEAASDSTLHAFEPASDIFAILQRNLAGTRAHLHPLALSDRNESKTLYCYTNQPDLAGMNSCYRRPEVERRLQQQTTATTVTAETLDSFCAGQNIRLVDFLKIDTEGSEFDVLRGAQGMLSTGRIGFIQFEYGGTYRDAHVRLQQVYEFLAGLHYSLYRIIPDGLVRISQWRDALENYRYSNYLAVAPGPAQAEPAAASQSTPKPAALPTPGICGILFSKDRCLQLDAALRSFLARCQDPASVALHVLYTASTCSHQQQYRQLAQDFPAVRFVPETDFAADCRRLLQPGRFHHVLFLVDDNLFVKDFRLADAVEALEVHAGALGFSLRLGRNTTYCYPAAKPQALPDFSQTGPGLLKFQWPAAELDFAYPLELSSSVYRTRDLGPILQQSQFDNPNHLEAQLSLAASTFAATHSALLCFEQSVAFCNPVNKVQNVAPANRTSARGAYSPARLAARYARGWRINIDALHNHVPHACHQEVELDLRRSAADRALPPAVSVIVLCHDYQAYLQEAIDSVFAQTFQDFEIILIDDGSRDRSLDIARQIVACHPPEIDVRFFQLDDFGPSRARRFGVEQSAARYVVHLDADDRIAPQFLEKTIPLLEANPALGFVYPDTVFFGDRTEWIHQPEYDFARLCQANFISYCSPIRREAFLQIDGYDRENWGYYEDWDLWIGLGAKGWHGQHLDQPLFFYRHHFDSSLSSFATRLGPLYRARLILRRPELYPNKEVAEARRLWAQMPPGWFSSPPLKEPDRLRALLDQHPRHQHLLFFLSLACRRHGRTAEARDALSQLLDLYPDDRQARQLLDQWSRQDAAQTDSKAQTQPGSVPSPTPVHSHTRASTSSAPAPLVSVIVPTFNRPHMLQEALGSLLAQTCRNLEILVVNDAGQDVSALVESLNPEGRIRYLAHERNRGLAAARNTGLQAARGQYIAYLDDDDVFYPHHVEALVRHLQTNRAQVAYADACRAQQELVNGIYQTTQRDVPFSSDWDNDRILGGNCVPVLCVMHAKTCLGKSGFFDETLTTHEDWEFWIRMSRHYSFHHLKQVTCEFRARSDGTSMTSGKRADFLRTARIIFDRYKTEAAGKPEVTRAREKLISRLERELVPPRPPTLVRRLRKAVKRLFRRPAVPQSSASKRPAPN